MAKTMLPAPGHAGVDYEERVEFSRLRATASAEPAEYSILATSARYYSSTSITSAM